MKKTSPKACVIGADGFIGAQLLREIRKQDPEAIGTSRRDKSMHFFDLAQPNIGPLRLAEKHIRYALITAAISNIAYCESNREETRLANVTGTIELVRQFRSEGIIPVFFSTDYVFNGEEGGYTKDTKPDPGTEYGRQKKEVEEQLPALCAEDYLIVRLSKVYALEKNSRLILGDIYSRLKKGLEVAAAYDLIFSPTFIGDVIGAVLRLVSAEARGVFHVAAPEAISRYNLTLKIANAMGAPIAKVKEVSLDKLSPSVKRPKNTSLVATPHASLEGFSYLGIDAAINKFLLSAD